MKIFNPVLLIFLSISAIAAEIPQPTKNEVEHLFKYLENSGCQFNRNNSWYTAGEAVEHIKIKYEYLLEKGKITTTESFIEMAATKSSMSGKQYEVKCGNKPSTPSSNWFVTELNNFRNLKTPN